jgi:hypothetical protein
MLQVVLLRINLDRESLGLPSKAVSKFSRQLYGYISCSHYSRYHHWVSGFLDEIQGKRVGNGMILVPKSTYNRVIEYLENYGASIEVISDQFFIEEGEYNRIEPMGKERLTQK